MPHPPIVVAEVGGRRTDEAGRTVASMREAARRIVAHAPASVVLISPHSPRRHGAFGLWKAPRVRGSFAPFGAPAATISLPGHPDLASRIAHRATERQINTWFIPETEELDHGAMVPLWFLVEAGWRGPTVVAGLTWPEGPGSRPFGEAIRAAIGESAEPVAVVASGDMSHRLKLGAPAGYHPDAAAFDDALIDILRSGDYARIERLDGRLRSDAAEDVVEPTRVVLECVHHSNTGHQVLSYEGPFGVGYGVAILFDEAQPRFQPEAGKSGVEHDWGPGLPDVARKSVTSWFSNRDAGPGETASAACLATRGVFVTLRDGRGDLRGCVGTILPRFAHVIEETWRNAREAAFRDPRFPPLVSHELRRIRFEVSVLGAPEPVESPDHLDPARFGVVVTSDDGRRGVLLPDIVGITTPEIQLKFARQKARIRPHELITIERFVVERFVESTHPE
jgi:AmmeMemoRadiSam system protein A